MNRARLLCRFRDLPTTWTEVQGEPTANPTQAAETLDVNRLTPDRRETTSDDADLDLRHLRCPLPVLRTRKHLQGMRPGATVRVLCTDPLAGLDIPHLLQETGDILVSHSVAGPVHSFDIRKRA